MVTPQHLSTAELAESMGLSKVRICQLVRQLKEESNIDVGVMAGNCRMFSPSDVAAIRSIDRRSYSK